jgi:hydrogenase maturation protease
MSHDDVDRIADAVLYEGYILYPYRPSVKNRQRWTFGGLYPEDYCRERGDGSAPANQTECLIRGTPATTFSARVRFLHLTERRVCELDTPLVSWPEDAEPALRPVPTLRVGESVYHEWQEAERREVAIGQLSLNELSSHSLRREFMFPGRRSLGPLRDEAGAIVAALVRGQEAVEGVVEAGAIEVGEGLFRVTLRVENRTTMDGHPPGDRDAATLRSLASSHAILGVRDGGFISLHDPPEADREAVAGCRNVGTWPVLVGAEGRAEAMLSAPIILYDYPRIAPESPGDFFDGTEIDELLTLRIMTLTDEEKGAMAAVDGRARTLLARTEATAREQLLGLHGTFRDVRPTPGGQAP